MRRGGKKGRNIHEEMCGEKGRAYMRRGGDEGKSTHEER